MADESFSNEEWATIGRAIARLRASVMAVVAGMLGGFGLFVATAWLVVRGAPDGVEIGQTLGLLNNYLPGYTVTWMGAILGLVYGALIGGAIGWSLAFVYNLVAGVRHPGLGKS